MNKNNVEIEYIDLRTQSNDSKLKINLSFYLKFLIIVIIIYWSIRLYKFLLIHNRESSFKLLVVTLIENVYDKLK